MNQAANNIVRPVIFALVMVSILAGATAYADVKLPAVIGDNMVLQQGVQVPIWGWAEPQERVEIRLANQTGSYATVADKDGRWIINLQPLEPGRSLEMTVRGNNRIEISNVLVGEVWVCSGQSNMQWPVQRANDAEKEIAAADYPKIRLFTVQRDTSGQPINDCVGAWTECSPETVPGFSAVGYFFGRHLHKELNLPIGLINTSWGGTRIEPWTPPVGVASVPDLKDISNEIASADTEYSKAVAESLGEIEQWVRDAKTALEENRPVPPAPAWPRHPLNSNRKPTGLYNAMIHPLVPFAIRGAIWYQGESNREDGLLYYQKMRALINGWRKVWNEGDFPFYYVQLAPFRYGGDPLLLPQIWEAQSNALALPNTGMAVVTDIANLTNIHPQNKQDVGRRLALWALAKTYGRKDLVYSGPLYKSMSVEGNKIRIRFEHAGGGLVSRDGRDPNWFTIAGDDKNFLQAQARIDGDTVLVWSDSVEKPIAARLGWNQEAEPNLMNKEGLPASPFRTDDWPVGEKTEK